MSIDIKIPSLGESVTEATISKWYKKEGDSVEVDELILEAETEKVTLEINATSSGIINKIFKNNGDLVKVGDIVGSLSEFSGDSTSYRTNDIMVNQIDKEIPYDNHPPSVKKLILEHKLDISSIEGSGKNGRITKGDVLDVINSNIIDPVTNKGSNLIRKEKMSRIRKTIAKRLKDSQNTAAILTTFNEIDMSKIIELRMRYREEFEKKKGIKLGFLSFFVKSVVIALQQIPSINAEIDGDEIIYKDYYDIGVAVGTEQGLVVPIIKGVEKLTFAEIEKNISIFSKRARDGKLSIADISGGTFTISNGGVYGSLLSTPIINPPQSAILGLHKIEERPIVKSGIIVARPMMYVALSYDHRLIDGKEAVTFLVKVKELIEEPEKLLLDL